jgi:hypothetical protein
LINFWFSIMSKENLDDKYEIQENKTNIIENENKIKDDINKECLEKGKLYINTDLKGNENKNDSYEDKKILILKGIESPKSVKKKNSFISINLNKKTSEITLDTKLKRNSSFQFKELRKMSIKLDTYTIKEMKSWDVETKEYYDVKNF